MLGPIGGYTNAEWVLTEIDVTVPLVNHKSVLEKKPSHVSIPPNQNGTVANEIKKTVLRKM